MSQASEQAVRSVLDSTGAFCKFLSANDCGATGSHQVGVLVSKSAGDLLFPGIPLVDDQDRNVRILWHDGLLTKSRLKYYKSKNELRITRFGRGFPHLRPGKVGSLFVLTRQEPDKFSAFLLDSADDTDEFLDAFAISPADTNRPIDAGRIRPETRERLEFAQYISGLETDFPSTEEISQAARNMCHVERSGPDETLLEWIRTEYALFRAIEVERYGDMIQGGFDDIDTFLDFAKTVLNRRKSRAGKSLENHLSVLFGMHGLSFETQAITENRKKPDFLFPSREAYCDPGFPVERLLTLGAKTTCKDRWRQILNEADRLRDRPKYLCTLQQGISSEQLAEMEAEKVVLVVPAPYIRAYPPEWRGRILSLSGFISHVQTRQAGGLG